MTKFGSVAQPHKRRYINPPTGIPYRKRHYIRAIPPSKAVPTQTDHHGGIIVIALLLITVRIICPVRVRVTQRQGKTLCSGWNCTAGGILCGWNSFPWWRFKCLPWAKADDLTILIKNSVTYPETVAILQFTRQNNHILRVKHHQAQHCRVNVICAVKSLINSTEELHIQYWSPSAVNNYQRQEQKQKHFPLSHTPRSHLINLN